MFLSKALKGGYLFLEPLKPLTSPKSCEVPTNSQYYIYISSLLKAEQVSEVSLKCFWNQQAMF